MEKIFLKSSITLDILLNSIYTTNINFRGAKTLNKQLLKQESLAYQQFKQCTRNTLAHIGDKCFSDLLDREVQAFNRFFILKTEKEIKKQIKY
jgi:hypothetical protein